MSQTFVKMNHTALVSVEGVGPRTFRLIVNYLKKNRILWQDFWVNKAQIWSKIRLSQKVVESIKKFKKEYTIESYWQYLQRKDISVVGFMESDFPMLLKQTADCPPILFIKGDIKLCSKLPIAIIGTRRMTAYGKLVTNKLAQELTMSGATIVSGFMYGVDVQAQQAALEAGGATVGVLGFGFDHIFPSSQRVLMQKMLATNRAVFVSEYPPFVRATKGTFPRRNRIIAGLSLAVIVTEAGPKSGTQITVGYALDYGRDVFAVSGPVTSPYHKGVKAMLNQGATLVGSGQEVINNLSANNWVKVGGETQAGDQGEANQLDLSAIVVTPLQQKILQALQSCPLTTQDLGEQLGEDTTTVSQVLTELELRGLVGFEANQWLAPPR
jgi:DNA processing protein